MLILASESPRRRELLGSLGIPFEIRSARVKELEQADSACSVSLLPQKNAFLKAEAVAGEYPGSVVLGADTAIIFEDRMIGKPRDLSDARNILSSLSGKTHQVITGIALVRTGEDGFCRQWSEISEVVFKPFGADVIEEYISKVHVLDKAGAYAIQECGEMIPEGRLKIRPYAVFCTKCKSKIEEMMRQ
jgi:septum formation protein